MMEKLVYVVMCEWIDEIGEVDTYPDKVFLEKKEAIKYMEEEDKKMRNEWVKNGDDPFAKNYSEEELRKEMAKTGYWHHFITQVELRFID